MSLMDDSATADAIVARLRCTLEGAALVRKVVDDVLAQRTDHNLREAEREIAHWREMARKAEEGEAEWRAEAQARLREIEQWRDAAVEREAILSNTDVKLAALENIMRRYRADRQECEADPEREEEYHLARTAEETARECVEAVRSGK